jgi:CMD domain protein
MKSAEPKDIIDHLAGIAPGSNLDGIRARRLQARENAQKSYLSLFEPADFGDVAAYERYAVAAFVAGVHEEPTVAAFYPAKLADRSELVAALKAEIERGKTKGPYGAFPAGPLSVEDTTGLIYRVATDRKPILGAKLAAALEHAHLLVFRPRDRHSLTARRVPVVSGSLRRGPAHARCLARAGRDRRQGELGAHGHE